MNSALAVRPWIIQAISLWTGILRDRCSIHHNKRGREQRPHPPLSSNNSSRSRLCLINHLSAPLQRTHLLRLTRSQPTPSPKGIAAVCIAEMTIHLLIAKPVMQSVTDAENGATFRLYVRFHTITTMEARYMPSMVLTTMTRNTTLVFYLRLKSNKIKTDRTTLHQKEWMDVRMNLYRGNRVSSHVQFKLILLR